MFISVIIPNYNHACYLSQRIQSVLNQTYQKFELIILDDCSNDGGASKVIIEGYRQNPHVTHIKYNDANSGSTFKQWERGISLAKGDYIWIAESDDFCAPSFLGEMVEMVKKNPQCSLVYSLSQQVDADGNPIGEKGKSFSNKVVKGKSFINRYMAFENPVYNASSAIFRKDVALSIDKQYMEYKGAGDRLFWIKLAELGDVGIVNKPLNYFRQHEDKVTPKKTFDGTNLKENYKIFDYLCSKGVLSKFRRYLVIGYSLYLVDSAKFASEEVRRELYALWCPNALPSRFQKLLGRMMVSLHYHHLQLYL